MRILFVLVLIVFICMIFSLINLVAAILKYSWPALPYIIKVIENLNFTENDLINSNIDYNFVGSYNNNNIYEFSIKDSSGSWNIILEFHKNIIVGYVYQHKSVYDKNLNRGGSYQNAQTIYLKRQGSG